MEEIFKKLKRLPTLAVSDRDFKKISNLISLLKTKNMQAFQQLLIAEDIKLSEPILDYLTKWFDLAHTIVQWSEWITHVWYQKNPRKLLGNEELLPLTLELLPQDLNFLKNQIQNKLNTAIKIETGSISTFLLVNLHAAIAIKLEEAQKQISPDEFPTDPAVIAVAEEVKLLNLIEQLKMACKEYLNCLLETLNGKPTVKNIYLQLSEDKFIKEIVGVLNLDSSSTQNDKLNNILEKYKIMGDMYLSLTRLKTDSQHKLDEFNAKFFQHLDSLKKTNEIEISLPKVGNLRFDHTLFKLPFFMNKEMKLIEKIAQLVYKNDSSELSMLNKNTKKIAQR